MKRLLQAATGIVALTALAIVLLPYIVSTEAAKAQITEALSDWLDTSVVVAGEPSMRFVPTLELTLPEVTIGGDDDDLRIKAQTIKAELNLIPLIVGHFDIAEFRLNAPQISVSRQYIAERLADRTTVGSLLERLSVHDFSIDKATVALTSDGLDPAIYNQFDLQLTWPSQESELSLRGGLIVSGELVEFRANFSNPLIISNPGQSTVSAFLANSLFQIRFEGTATGGKFGPKVLGALEFGTSSVRRLAGWLGFNLGEGAAMGPFALNGEAEITEKTVLLPKVSVEIDGNAAEGALSIERDQIWSISGSLAAEKLDISPYTEEIFSAFADGTVQSLAADILTPESANIDMQISADQVLIGDIRLGRTSCSFLLQDGSMALEVGESLLYGGSMSLSAGTKPLPGSVGIQLSARIKDVRLGNFNWFDSTLKIASGTVNSATLALTSSGASFVELFAGLKGDVKAEGTDLTLEGVGVSARVDSFNDEQPAPSAADEEAMRSRFSTFTFDGAMADKMLVVKSITADSELLDITARGSISLASEQVGLEGTATIKKDQQALLSVPVKIRGPYKNPRLRPISAPDTPQRVPPDDTVEEESTPQVQ
ncbi:MAG: hypothetical protein ABJN26_10380 [Stappiaceae bacterium]